MPRDKRHIILNTEVNGERYQSRASGGGSKAYVGVPDRAEHARALMAELEWITPAIEAENLAGAYLDFSGREYEPLKKDSLDSSGLKLIKYSEGDESRQTPSSATVFATSSAIAKLKTKVSDYETRNNPDKEKNGQVVPGTPKNAPLIESIATIKEAALQQLWFGSAERFPITEEPCYWEVWLDKNQVQSFLEKANQYEITISSERIEFPEEVIVLALANKDQLGEAVRHIAGAVLGLAPPGNASEFFLNLDAFEQDEWVQDLVDRTNFASDRGNNYISILDRGASRAHPLLQPALDPADRYAADPAWGVEDDSGHGTGMAGLALFGDLSTQLQGGMPISINTRIESGKIIPNSGQNPHHLYGAITRNAIDFIETAENRKRIYVMAVTTSDDFPHDGAPTSWSAALDQLCSGTTGNVHVKRLMVVSAGNSDETRLVSPNYLDDCDNDYNEVESPAQAWNPICVGAYTEKLLPTGSAETTVAPMGDLSPSSRTSSWEKIWPIKPDIVMEGGNWVQQTPPPPTHHDALSLVSTNRDYPRKSFVAMHDTSASSALAAKEISELQADYPNLWPETIRALYVSSARWNNQMLSHLPANPNKGDYRPLFQRYGYGVPNLLRARRSASNALSLIIQDTIQPYGWNDAQNNVILNQMKLYTLPWPVEALRELGASNVTLRVALSTFIVPNPSEYHRGNKYNYASHNLRFKLNRPDENEVQFKARINGLSEGEFDTGDNSWTFGSQRRDVGSLHIDQLICAASDLARQNLIAVHPISGWWKSKRAIEEGNQEVRFALVIEIDAEEVSNEIDLYAEIQSKITTATEV